MSRKNLIHALIALAIAALALPAAASARSSAILFSKVIEDHSVVEIEGEVQPPKDPEGGIYAARGHRVNRLTKNPTDAEPSFSSDGRAIAFRRGDDIYTVRADGSGLRQLTSGAEIDGRPLISPNGRFVLFERRASEGAPRDLFTVKTTGGTPRRIAATAADEHEASFAPSGRLIAFVRSFETAAGANDEVFSVKPNGRKLRRLTRSADLDEWAPVALGARVVFSRGVRAEDESAYADIYSVGADGRKLRKVIAGVGSAYVDDVFAAGKRPLVLFHRKGGLWLKRLGSRSRRLVAIGDETTFSAVFSSDGTKVALYQATEEEQWISVVEVGSGSVRYTAAAAYPASEPVSSTIGPAIAWQPVR